MRRGRHLEWACDIIVTLQIKNVISLYLSCWPLEKVVAQDEGPLLKISVTKVTKVLSIQIFLSQQCTFNLIGTLFLSLREEELVIFAFLNLYVTFHEIHGNFRKLTFVSPSFSGKFSSFWISIWLKKNFFRKNFHFCALISIFWRIGLRIRNPESQSTL